MDPFARVPASRMATWRRIAHRHALALVIPLIVALPPLVWVVDATHRASLTTLGRDQGIFQYVAWALEKGLVDYKEVRDVNGPLTHLIHFLFLKLGGADEHRFRLLDMWVTGFTFALFGACLPGVVKKGRISWSERAGWAFASWVVLSAQLLQYIWWDLAQRESFFDWFVLSAVAVQLVAQRALSKSDGRPPPFGREVLLLGLAGALSVMPWFGKPTYVLFTVCQLVALVTEDTTAMTRRRRLVTFGVGGVLGALVPLSFLVVYGDAATFFHIYLVDVPAMYRFMMPRSPAEILSLEWGGTTVALALATSALLLALVWDKQLPRRFLSVIGLPLAGVVSVLAQSKGFPYHFHPVTLGLSAEWLLVVVWLAEKFRHAPKQRAFARLVPFVAAVTLAVKVGVSMQGSPHINDLWILAKANDAEDRASHDYLIYFTNTDFFPWEMRQVAAYLQANTKPDDQVQIYGMDAYVLFLARRTSPTPYIYSYDLNADSALGGSWLPRGIHPSPPQAEKIREIVASHDLDMLTKLEQKPPAAFVFFDGSPLTSEADASMDFVDHCPHSGPWMRAHYTKTVAFGHDQVWMRNDLARGLAPSEPHEEDGASPE